MAQQRIEPVQENGHTFFPGADSMTHFEEGAFFFYMVSYKWQDGPNSMRSGAASTHGIVCPADKVQYGRLVNDILGFVRGHGLGAPGYQVIDFFHIMPQTQYRDPLAVQQEQADRKQADRDRKELSA